MGPVVEGQGGAVESALDGADGDGEAVLAVGPGLVAADPVE